MRFGSWRLRDQILPSLRHLERPHRSDAVLTVFIHDAASAPWVADFLLELSPPGSDSEIWLVDSPDLTLIVQRQGQMLSALDRKSGKAYWLIAQAARIPYLERAAPMRLLLGHWLGRLGRYLVHAAAVGSDSGGVLIVGEGGAGKSTTALACLEFGLRFAADDHCVVSDEASPYVHSLFGTGKVGAAEWDRFPSFAAARETAGRRPEEKGILFLDRLPDVRVVSGLSLRAILVARICRTVRTRVRAVSPADAFRAIAPSCALHFQAERPRVLGYFARLVRRLPAYRLELGSDWRSTPVAIRDLLDGSFGEEGAGFGRETR